MRVTAVALMMMLMGLAGASEETPWPADATENGGHHYWAADDVEDLSWQGAREQCEKRGGYLAVVTTEAEAHFVASLADGRYLYLGASDADEEGSWAWVDGTPWEFTFWYDGQPNDYGGTEDFLATYTKGRWVDVDASGEDFWMPTGFLCEWGD